ncbi:MAG TPA: carboxypeptidase-like regulatory domain-containing protein, partial [Agriterribacter sp.]|nr:carboxypeptidase-like regulatory domain-containing protein [Agriterribacter sp.]
MSLSAKNAMGQEILNKKITISLKNETLFDALERIGRQNDIQFFYATNIIDPADRVNITAKKTSLGEFLSELLQPYMLYYIVSNNKIVIRKDALKFPGSGVHNEDGTPLPPVYEKAQVHNTDVSGRVMSSAGEYLPGVTVQVKGGGAATKTDINGFFRLSVPDNSI